MTALHYDIFDLFLVLLLFTAFTYNMKLDTEDIASTVLFPTLTFYTKRNGSSITPTQMHDFFFCSTQTFQKQKRRNPASKTVASHGNNNHLLSP